jgi:hypothetical protein
MSVNGSVTVRKGEDINRAIKRLKKVVGDAVSQHRRRIEEGGCSSGVRRRLKDARANSRRARQERKRLKMEGK